MFWNKLTARFKNPEPQATIAAGTAALSTEVEAAAPKEPTLAPVVPEHEATAAVSPEPVLEVTPAPVADDTPEQLPPPPDEVVLSLNDLRDAPVTPSDATLGKLSLKARAQHFAQTIKAKVSRKEQDPKAKALFDQAWFNGAQGIPSRIFIGYLAEVTQKDARSYALGIALKHNNNPTISYYDAFPFEQGFAYEVHEGGPARAYLPEILKYFETQGGYTLEEEGQGICIKTATRTVRVERAKDGLVAYLLPESAEVDQTAWLKPGPKLKAVYSLNKGFLGGSAIVFGVSILALVVSLITRYQPYEAPPAAGMEKVDYNRLPISQWPLLLEKVQQQQQVDALTYENGKWEIKATPLASAIPAAPSVPAPPPGMPVSTPAVQAQPGVMPTIPTPPVPPAAPTPAGTAKPTAPLPPAPAPTKK